MATPGNVTATLTFDDAVVTLDAAVRATARLDLALEPGELVLLDPGSPAHAATVADACCGLVPPARGAVRFLGHDWSALAPDAANALRGRIGQTFAHGGWIEHLPVIDNVLLQQRHHHRGDDARLRAEAMRLAGHFGLPGVPLGYPREHSPSDLRRSACVRAFLGQPAVVLLDEPLAGEPGLLEPLVNAALATLARGAVVIWMTASRRIWRDASLPADRRLHLAGGTLVSD
ncbi:MAG: organic solvent ABC transporter ATP-binding protein [Gammaproteobacteria bacterium]|jgi:phospholipid/cholesterol/gamma-HCH transport system ATP-binding protein|nr:organic solvent ABC transporter ATP-binding protein [Gammaproteobacteria bacterium]